MSTERRDVIPDKAASRQPSIALVMIVRNEEKVLRRCLASASPWVDEIIVVDTGSSDATGAIAAEMGAKIFSFPWIDDFAAARNFAVAQSGCDWLLSLDADEELIDGAQLRPLVSDLENKGHDAAALRMCDVDAKLNVYNDYAVGRLWRTGRGIAFVGRVHEKLRLSAPPILLPLRVRHYGYRDISRECEIAKSERNLRLLEMDLAERPGDLELAEHKLRCLEIIGRLEEAAEWAATLLTLHAIPKLGCSCSFSGLSVLEQCGRLPVDLLEQALEAWPKDPDLCYLAAVVSLRLGRHDAAAQLLLLWLRLVLLLRQEAAAKRCLSLGRLGQIAAALRQLAAAPSRAHMLAEADELLRRIGKE